MEKLPKLEIILGGELLDKALNAGLFLVHLVTKHLGDKPLATHGEHFIEVNHDEAEPTA